MHQLLGSQPTVPDGTLLHELFLQSLPQNASDMSLDKLTTLADSVVEVTNPAVSPVIPIISTQQLPSPSPPTQPPPSSEVAGLCRSREFSRTHCWLPCFAVNPRFLSPPYKPQPSPFPAPFTDSTLWTTDGDRWPTSFVYSPFLCAGHHLGVAFPR